MKKKPGKEGIVFSTDPSFHTAEWQETTITLPDEKQPLRIKMDKKQRAGKAVTLILGFSGKEEDLESLGRRVKNFCGTGGSVKNGEIIIQGDQRDKILQWFKKNDFHLAKLVG